MNTFGCDLPPGWAAPPAPRRIAPPPRRATVTTAFVVLAVAGAAGAYLGVVTGLSSLLTQTTVAGPVPPAVEATSNTGLGSGPAPKRAAPKHPAATRTRTAAPAAPVAPEKPVLPVAPTTPPVAAAPGPVRTVPPSPSDCGLCEEPPVPTPTAPDPWLPMSPSPSDSAWPSDPASPAPSSSPTPTPSASPTPTPSASPADFSESPVSPLSAFPPDEWPEPSDNPWHHRHSR